MNPTQIAGPGYGRGCVPASTDPGSESCRPVGHSAAIDCLICALPCTMPGSAQGILPLLLAGYVNLLALVCVVPRNLHRPAR